MVDRVYKGAIPSFRTELEELKRESSRLRSRTDWNRLRVEPLIRHVASLERILESERFGAEIARLRRGMGMFRSDRVYLRTNLSALQDTLPREKKRAERRS